MLCNLFVDDRRAIQIAANICPTMEYVIHKLKWNVYNVYMQRFFIMRGMGILITEDFRSATLQNFTPKSKVLAIRPHRCLMGRIILVTTQRNLFVDCGLDIYFCSSFLVCWWQLPTRVNTNVLPGFFRHFWSI